MATAQPNDQFLVNRDGVSYNVTQANLMAEIQDTDLMLVNRDDVSYKITGAEVKDSFVDPLVITSIFLSTLDPIEGEEIAAIVNVTGGKSPTEAYQWRRDGVNITEATNAIYLVEEADVGSKLDCVVTVTDTIADTVTDTSPETNPVRPNETVNAPTLLTPPNGAGLGPDTIIPITDSIASVTNSSTSTTIVASGDKDLSSLEPGSAKMTDASGNVLSYAPVTSSITKIEGGSTEFTVTNWQNGGNAIDGNVQTQASSVNLGTDPNLYGTVDFGTSLAITKFEFFGRVYASTNKYQLVNSLGSVVGGSVDLTSSQTYQWRTIYEGPAIEATAYRQQVDTGDSSNPNYTSDDIQGIKINGSIVVCSNISNNATGPSTGEFGSDSTLTFANNQDLTYFQPGDEIQGKLSGTAVGPNNPVKIGWRRPANAGDRAGTFANANLYGIKINGIELVEDPNDPIYSNATSFVNYESVSPSGDFNQPVTVFSTTADNRHQAFNDDTTKGFLGADGYISWAPQEEFIVENIEVFIHELPDYQFVFLFSNGVQYSNVPPGVTGVWSPLAPDGNTITKVISTDPANSKMTVSGGNWVVYNNSQTWSDDFGPTSNEYPATQAFDGNPDTAGGVVTSGSFTITWTSSFTVPDGSTLKGKFNTVDQPLAITVDVDGVTTDCPLTNQQRGIAELALYTNNTGADVTVSNLKAVGSGPNTETAGFNIYWLAVDNALFVDNIPAVDSALLGEGKVTGSAATGTGTVAVVTAAADTVLLVASNERWVSSGAWNSSTLQGNAAGTNFYLTGDEVQSMQIDGSDFNMTCTQFKGTGDPVYGTTTWQVTTDADTAFANPVVNVTNTSETFYNVTTLANDAIYRARVKQTSTQGTESHFSDVNRFKTTEPVTANQIVTNTYTGGDTVPLTVGNGSGFSIGNNVSLTTTYTPETSAITTIDQDASDDTLLTFTDATDLQYFQAGDILQTGGRIYSNLPINVDTTSAGGPAGAFNGEFNNNGAQALDFTINMGFEFDPPLTGVESCQLAVNNNEGTLTYVDANDVEYAHPNWMPDGSYILSTNTPAAPSTIKKILWLTGQITAISINGVVLINSEQVEVISTDIASNQMRVSGGTWTVDATVSTASPKRGAGTVANVSGNSLTINPWTDNAFVVGRELEVDGQLFYDKNTSSLITASELSRTYGLLPRTDAARGIHALSDLRYFNGGTTRRY